jgi:hypothetical protein
MLEKIQRPGTQVTFYPKAGGEAIIGVVCNWFINGISELVIEVMMPNDRKTSLIENDPDTKLPGFTLLRPKKAAKPTVLPQQPHPPASG